MVALENELVLGQRGGLEETTMEYADRHGMEAAADEGQREKCVGEEGSEDRREDLRGRPSARVGFMPGTSREKYLVWQRVNWGVGRGHGKDGNEFKRI